MACNPDVRRRRRMITFIIGLFVGCGFGVTLMSLLRMAKQN